MSRRGIIWIAIGSLFALAIAAYVATHIRISRRQTITFVRADYSWVELVTNGDIKAVRQRIADQPVEARRYRFVGTPLLHYAVESGRLDVVRALLENGADVNAVIEGKDVAGAGTTAVEAAVGGDDLKMVTLLAEHGADLSVLDSQYGQTRTLTDIARDMQHKDMVELLGQLTSSKAPSSRSK